MVVYTVMFFIMQASYLKINLKLYIPRSAQDKTKNRGSMVSFKTPVPQFVIWLKA